MKSLTSDDICLGTFSSYPHCCKVFCFCSTFDFLFCFVFFLGHVPVVISVISVTLGKVLFYSSILVSCNCKMFLKIQNSSKFLFYSFHSCNYTDVLFTQVSEKEKRVRSNFLVSLHALFWILPFCVFLFALSALPPHSLFS